MQIVLRVVDRSASGRSRVCRGSRPWAPWLSRSCLPDLQRLLVLRPPDRRGAAARPVRAAAGAAGLGHQ